MLLKSVNKTKDNDNVRKIIIGVIKEKRSSRKEFYSIREKERVAAVPIVDASSKFRRREPYFTAPSDLGWKSIAGVSVLFDYQEIAHQTKRLQELDYDIDAYDRELTSPVFRIGSELNSELSQLLFLFL